jgi:hypothetical protein
MAQLHEFVKDLAKKPPRTVSASHLDRNFVLDRPMKRGLLQQCNLQYGEEGWWCEVPPPPGGTSVLACVGGIVQWLQTEDCA